MSKRIGLVLIISFVVAIFCYASIELASYIQQLNNFYPNLAADNHVVATVDQFCITRHDVELYKMNEQISITINSLFIKTEKRNPLLNKKAILKDLIEEHVLYLEAQKRGLVASDDAVNQYVSTEKAYFEDLDIKELAVYRDLLDRQGLTADQYYDSMKPRYKAVISIGNLKVAILRGSSWDERTEAWDQYRSDIMKQYQSLIHIY
jgi:hypothetical protein